MKKFSITQEELKNFLQNISVFKQLETEHIDSLVPSVLPIQFDSGISLLKQDQDADGVYVVKQGEVEILVNGERVAQLGNDACIGEMSCLTGEKKASATVRTTTPSKVVVIERDKFMEVVNQSPKVWQSLFQVMTKRFYTINTRFSEVMQHTSQGLMKIDKEANITNEFSISCKRYFGKESLLGISFPELIYQGDEKKVEDFKQIYSQLFQAPESSFDLYTDLLPNEVIYLRQEQKRYFSLKYYPCKNSADEISAIDVGIEDITKIREFSIKTKRAEREKTILRHIYDAPDSFLVLLELMDKVKLQLKDFQQTLHKNQNDEFRLMILQTMRLLHNLKGNAGMFHLEKMVETAHALESELESFLKQGTLPQERQDQLFSYIDILESQDKYSHSLIENISPELQKRLFGIVLSEDQFNLIKNYLRKGDYDQLNQLIDHIEMVEVNDLVKSWSKELERLNENLGKHGRLSVKKSGLKIPKKAFTELEGPLIHVLRNSIDHGIEDPEIRSKRNKPSEGEIRFEAKDTREDKHEMMMDSESPSEFSS